MDVFILEPITSELASQVIREVHASKGEPLDVHIMSLGGEMLAGSAINAVLRNSPNHVTTHVIGVAASMAAVISQAGDTRLIAPDANFNIHNGAMGSTGGRGTKEEHLEAAETLAKLDATMMKSFDKTGLSTEELQVIMHSDKLLTADEAVQLGFFDGYAKPVQAVAEFNNKIKEMSKLSELMAQVDTAALRLGLRETDNAAKKALVASLEKELKAQVDQVIEEVVDTADTGAEILTSEMVSREEFEMFKAEIMALIAPLLGAVEELPTPEETTTMVEETTTAKLNNLLQAIKSKTVAPGAKQSFDQPEAKAKEDWSVYEARKREIANKNNR